jgi:hypothetical protein
MTKHRRLKKHYTALHDDPGLLFPGCEVLLYPNGQPEIWIRTPDGKHSVKITASRGPVGMRISVNRFPGTAPITTTGNLSSDSEIMPQVDAAEVSMCQYDNTQRAEDFKAWYGTQGTENEAPYPKREDYNECGARITPRKDPS